MKFKLFFYSIFQLQPATGGQVVGKGAYDLERFRKDFSFALYNRVLECFMVAPEYWKWNLKELLAR